MSLDLIIFKTPSLFILCIDYMSNEITKTLFLVQNYVNWNYVIHYMLKLG